MFDESPLGARHWRSDESEMFDAEIANFLHDPLVVPAIEGMPHNGRHNSHSAFSAFAMDENRPIVRIRDQCEDLPGLLVGGRSFALNWDVEILDSRRNLVLVLRKLLTEVDDGLQSLLCK